MSITAHLVFDILAYSVAIVLYIGMHHRLHDDGMPSSTRQRWAVAIGAFAMGIVGARAIVPFESGLPMDFAAFIQGFENGGKSIVGGLMGGILGVKLVKFIFIPSAEGPVRRSFGDQTLFPVGIGICIARIGCFVSGMADDTYGVPTESTYGWDYGDGILRQPAQLYEIVGITGLLWTIQRNWKRARHAGDRFKWFMLGYCLLRFGLEFIRIHPAPYAGLSVYQVVCAAGAVWAALGRF